MHLDTDCFSFKCNGDFCCRYENNGDCIHQICPGSLYFSKRINVEKSFYSQDLSVMERWEKRDQDLLVLIVTHWLIANMGRQPIVKNDIDSYKKM